MTQITAIVDDETLENLDNLAAGNGLSRSKQVSRCLVEYFEPKADDKELERLKAELTHYQAFIQSKDDRIKDLQTQLGWLTLEYTKVNDRLLLPPARPWWKFWTKKEK